MWLAFCSKADAKSSRQYRGIHFGKLSSKRTDFGGRGGPGPGDYDPYREVQMKAENANIHEEESTMRYEARIPRYNEAIVKDTEKKVRILQGITWLANQILKGSWCHFILYWMAFLIDLHE